MLKIRLQRIGKKNQPSYRVVLVEHTFRPQGKYIEDLGSYNPKSKQKQFNKERILYWISKGAQVSPTMHNFLVDEKIIDKAKVKAWKPKKRAEAKSAEVPTGVGAKVENPEPAPETVPTPETSVQDVVVDTQPKTE